MRVEQSHSQSIGIIRNEKVLLKVDMKYITWKLRLTEKKKTERVIMSLT